MGNSHSEGPAVFLQQRQHGSRLARKVGILAKGGQRRCDPAHPVGLDP